MFLESLFQGNSVKSKRIIYTPSNFAKTTLLHLQEVGELTAIKPHVNSREGLNSFLFFIVTNGKGKLLYDNKEYSLNKNNCVFIDCRKTYSHSSSKDNLWSLKWVHFYGANLNGIYEKYAERGGMPTFSPESTSYFSKVLDEISYFAESDDYIRDMKINEKLTSLLTLIMAESWHPENTARIGVKKKSLQNIKYYLDEHYTEKIHLDDLAERFYINKFYLTRVFKEQFGITLLSYLDQVRITHAKQLLRFSELTVEEVGRKVGIEEGAYFNRVFKKVEGITPGEYRRMWE
ncbi:MAG: helix-turn-helix domain-containing protein [Clostridia bacterium]|nr:helix-turn-helix domain-containing protein [Clostridia bacterium]